MALTPCSSDFVRRAFCIGGWSFGDFGDQVGDRGADGDRAIETESIDPIAIRTLLFHSILLLSEYFVFAPNSI